MATEQQVKDRRAENERLRKQIAEVKSKQAAELREANEDIALARADRENASLEAELASLLKKPSASGVLATAPGPDTETPLVAPEAAQPDSVPGTTTPATPAVNKPKP